MDQGKNREAIIILASVVVIILVAYLGIGPAITSLRKSNFTIKTKGADLDLAEENLANLRFLQSSIDSKTDEVNALISTMPSYVDSEDLIISLEAIANKNGMQLTGIAPVNMGIDLTAEEEIMIEEGMSGKGIRGIEEAQYDVTIRGSYQSLQNFMANLEASRRPIKVTRVTMTKESAGEEGSILNIILGITSYFTPINK